MNQQELRNTNKNTIYISLAVLVILAILGTIWLVYSNPTNNTNNNPNTSNLLLSKNESSFQSTPTNQNNSSNINQSPTQNSSNSQNTSQNSIAVLTSQDLTIGTGSELKSGQTIKVHYTGTLQDGTKFDSSLDRNEPFTFQIGTGSVIPGWDIGLLGDATLGIEPIKVGGKRKLTIPPNLAYGSRGAGKLIPPNSTLIFEVEVLS
jgi:FKBP-type peptidyl-prolyl cis-trans isomerase